MAQLWEGDDGSSYINFQTKQINVKKVEASAEVAAGKIAAVVAGIYANVCTGLGAGVLSALLPSGPDAKEAALRSELSSEQTEQQVKDLKADPDGLWFSMIRLKKNSQRQEGSCMSCFAGKKFVMEVNGDVVVFQAANQAAFAEINAILNKEAQSKVKELIDDDPLQRLSKLPQYAIQWVDKALDPMPEGPSMMAEDEARSRLFGIMGETHEFFQDDDCPWPPTISGSAPIVRYPYLHDAILDGHADKACALIALARIEKYWKGSPNGNEVNRKVRLPAASDGPFARLANKSEDLEEADYPPLHLAAARGLPDVCHLLLKQGALKTQKIDALELAIAHGHIEATKVLLKDEHDLSKLQPVFEKLGNRESGAPKLVKEYASRLRDHENTHREYEKFKLIKNNEERQKRMEDMKQKFSNSFHTQEMYCPFCRKNQEFWIVPQHAPRCSECDRELPIAADDAGAHGCLAVCA